jgi:hypothetical protein
MKTVWLGIEVFNDFCNYHKEVVKVFSEEDLALVWVQEVVPTEQEYREYRPIMMEE